MPNQVATLTLNGDTEASRAIISHSLSFNNKTDIATVFITVLHDFADASPLFDWWFSHDPGKVEIAIVNMNVKEGEGTRNITLENATCTNYSESFNGTVAVIDDVCYPIVTLTIEAETITMGGTSFVPE